MHPDARTQLQLGNAHFAQSRLDEAATAYERALRLAPGHPIAGLNLGITYNALGAFAQSVAILRAHLDAHPDDDEARVALADSLASCGSADEAARLAADVVERQPRHVEALLLLGRLAYERAAFDEARRFFAEAAHAAPERHEPELNLAALAHGLGRVDEAVAHGERAVERAPNDPLAHLDLGMSLLLGGAFRRGLGELEWRMRDPRLRADYPYRDRLPLWQGEPLAGPLLVARDQGLGDFILWSRLFPLLTERGVRFAVETPPPLVPLSRDAAGAGEIVAGRIAPERLPEFAAHVPICSLASALGVEEAAAVREVPYLGADPVRTAAFRARFAALGKRRAVGIAWAGDPSHELDRFRSCGLAPFAALRGIDDVAWISLQVGPRAHDARPPGLAVLDLSPDLTDLAATAAAIAALDLVITVDTAIVHLAGALGAPVWLLHGFGHYWLWGTQRTTTPWYPTLRIFRQHRPNVWDDVFTDLRTALNEGPVPP